MDHLMDKGQRGQKNFKGQSIRYEKADKIHLETKYLCL